MSAAVKGASTRDRGAWGGGRASTDRTIRSILSMLHTADQQEGDALAQLYRLLVWDVFPDCQPRQVDVLIQALARLSLKRPAMTGWKATRKLYGVGEETSSEEELVSPIGFIMQEKDTLEEDVTAPPMDSAQEKSELDSRGIRDLLIYRSLLFAYICLTTLDNSDILESGIGNNIVPFI
ncbi:hypothetical protein PG987_004933 [Apiospora arundinis]